jgi:Tfp pilus assembly protein PilX
MSIVAEIPYGLKAGPLMKTEMRNNGVVFLIVVFAIVLIATITMGILVMTTEEVQLMQNQLYAAEAICTAEAGLNDAFARIRTNPVAVSFSNSFNGGTYNVNVTGTPPTQITSFATSSQGYDANVVADITVGTSAPYIIRIDNLRINE